VVTFFVVGAEAVGLTHEALKAVIKYSMIRNIALASCYALQLQNIRHTLSRSVLSVCFAGRASLR